MTAIVAAVACPICGQVVKESLSREVMLTHCDGLGRLCPFSGQPFGGLVQSSVRYLMDANHELEELFG